MRILIFALALLAAACSPPAQNTASTTATTAADTAPQTPANPYAAALASQTQSGVWATRSDEGVTSTCFGAPQSECVVSVVCEQPSGKITLTFGQELAPDQDTTVRLFTATQTFDLPGRSFNEGLPSVSVEIADAAPEKSPLIGMLGTPTERFGAEIAGQRTVFPWDASIAAVLTACR